MAAVPRAIPSDERAHATAREADGRERERGQRARQEQPPVHARAEEDRIPLAERSHRQLDELVQLARVSQQTGDGHERQKPDARDARPQPGTAGPGDGASTLEDAPPDEPR